MSRKEAGKPTGGPVKPTLPKHLLNEPLSRLLALGADDYPEDYAEIASKLRAGDAMAAANQLVGMVLDDDYNAYLSDDYAGGRTGDKRAWAPLHALRVLGMLGTAAEIGIEPMLGLLGTEDDYMREDLPFFFAAAGEPAVERLSCVFEDSAEPPFRRSGANEALAEIAELHPMLRESIVRRMEQCLAGEHVDAELNAFIVGSLCDLGAKDSFPLIEAAFQAGHIDKSVIDLAYVREHLGWRTQAPPMVWPAAPRGPQEARERKAAELAAAAAAAAPEPNLFEDEPAEPYVAPLKVGRNESCPCGSGKKFKKCCGS